MTLALSVTRKSHPSEISPPYFRPVSRGLEGLRMTDASPAFRPEPAAGTAVPARPPARVPPAQVPRLTSDIPGDGERRRLSPEQTQAGARFPGDPSEAVRAGRGQPSPGSGRCSRVPSERPVPFAPRKGSQPFPCGAEGTLLCSSKRQKRACVGTFSKLVVSVALSGSYRNHKKIAPGPPVQCLRRGASRPGLPSAEQEEPGRFDVKTGAQQTRC